MKNALVGPMVRALDSPLPVKQKSRLKSPDVTVLAEAELLERVLEGRHVPRVREHYRRSAIARHLVQDFFLGAFLLKLGLVGGRGWSTTAVKPLFLKASINAFDCTSMLSTHSFETKSLILDYPCINRGDAAALLMTYLRAASRASAKVHPLYGSCPQRGTS